MSDNPTGWPSRHEVLAELRQRNPARYERCVNFSYSRGSGDGATVEQIADEIEKVDRELANPLINLASRLGGMVFMLEDSIRPRIDLADGYPGKPVELSGPERLKQRTYRECADLMREAETMLRGLASLPQPPSGEGS